MPMSDEQAQEIRRVQRELSKPGNVHGLAPRLPLRGFIKAGMKGEVRQSSGGKNFQLPQKIDYFRITTTQRDGTGNFTLDAEIHKLLGDKPTKIPVMLLFNDIDLNLQSRYGAMKKMRFWCTGNGVEAVRWNKQFTEQFIVPCTCPLSNWDYEPAGADADPACKLLTTLSVMINLPEIKGVGGVWRFRTGSINSHDGLKNPMEFIRLLTRGVLAGIPLNLVLRPKATVTPGGAATTVFIAALEYEQTTSQLQDYAVKLLEHDATFFERVREMEARAKAAGIASPTADEDAEEVAEEFHPEQAAAGHGATLAPEPSEATASNGAPATAAPRKVEAEPEPAKTADKPATEAKPRPTINPDNII